MENGKIVCSIRMPTFLENFISNKKSWQFLLNGCEMVTWQNNQFSCCSILWLTGWQISHCTSWHFLFWPNWRFYFQNVPFYSEQFRRAGGRVRAGPFLFFFLTGCGTFSRNERSIRLTMFSTSSITHTGVGLAIAKAHRRVFGAAESSKSPPTKIETILSKNRATLCLSLSIEERSLVVFLESSR